MQAQDPSEKADSVHHPHDMLFKTVFLDPTKAAAFLQAHLPTDLSAQN